MSIINEEADIHFSLRMISEKHDDDVLRAIFIKLISLEKIILLKLAESTLGI